jgi:hypothetical protein
MGTQHWVVAPGTPAERADVAQPLWSEGIDYMPLAKLLQNHGRSLGLSAILNGSEVELIKDGASIPFNEGCNALIDAHLISQLPESLRPTGNRTTLSKPALRNNLSTQVSVVESPKDVLTTLQAVASGSGAPELYVSWESQVLQSPEFCSFRIQEFGASISVYQKDYGYMICLNDPSNSLMLPNSLTADTCVDDVTCSMKIPHNEHSYVVIDLEGGLTQTGIEPLIVARHAAGEYKAAFSDRCTVFGSDGMYQIHINVRKEDVSLSGSSTPVRRLLDNRIVAAQLPEYPLSLVVTVTTTDSQLVTNPAQIKEMR